MSFGVGAPTPAPTADYSRIHPPTQVAGVGGFFCPDVSAKTSVKGQMHGLRPPLTAVFPVGHHSAARKRSLSASCGHLFGSSILPPGTRRLISGSGRISPPPPPQGGTRSPKACQSRPPGPSSPRERTRVRADIPVRFDCSNVRLYSAACFSACSL